MPQKQKPRIEEKAERAELPQASGRSFGYPKQNRRGIADAAPLLLKLNMPAQLLFFVPAARSGAVHVKKGASWTVIANLVVIGGMSILYLLMYGLMGIFTNDQPLYPPQPSCSGW